MSSTVATPTPLMRHPSPPLWALGMVFTVLFIAGLVPVTIFGGMPYFPGPGESKETIQAFFLARPNAALLCAFFHFGSAIPLGLFTASIVSRLQFFGVRAAGAHIALFGGLATAFNLIASSSMLWTMAHPGIAQDATLTHALYWAMTAFGGPGYSVPLGILMAGVSVTAGFYKLLPKWLVIFGLVLAVCGELSWLNLLSGKALFLVPLTRFPGFVWMIATGFAMPSKIARKA